MHHILQQMEKALIKNGKRHVHRVKYLPNHFCLRIELGMVIPTRMADLWDTDSVAYNPRLSRLLSR